MTKFNYWHQRFNKIDRKSLIDNLLISAHYLLIQELKQAKNGIIQESLLVNEPDLIKPKIKRLSVLESIFEIQKEIDERKNLLKRSTLEQMNGKFSKLSISLNHQN